MPIAYKIDVLAQLKTVGYSTYRIRKDKLLSESTVQKLRAGHSIGWDNLETICRLLQCQPGDILDYTEDIQ